MDAVFNCVRRLNLSALPLWFRLSRLAVRSGSSTRTQRLKTAFFVKSRAQGLNWALLGTTTLAYALPWKKADENEEVKEDPVVTALKRGILAMKKGNLEDSKAFFHAGLQIASEQHRNNEVDDRQFLLMQINVFDSLADVAMKLGQLDDAEKLYKEVMLKCIQSGRSQDDESVVELSIKLASIYAMQSRADMAEKGFKFCTEVTEQKVKAAGGTADADSNLLALHGLGCHSYARFLMKQKRSAEAIKYFLHTLDVATEVYGADHPQVLNVMNDVASAHVINKQYGEGVFYYKEAISRAQRSEQMEDILPALLYNLGEACILTRDFGKARKYCSRCEVISTKLGDNKAVTLAKQCLKDVAQVEAKVTTSQP